MAMDMLLWRCPLCATNDALVHRRRVFRPEWVRCRACGTVWQVIRVMGEDYRLRVIEGERAWVGLELPLAEWYDRMKAGLELVPLKDVPLALPEGEVGYLQSRRARLFARTNDPTFFGEAAARVPEEQAHTRVVGWGQILLTNERLIWQGALGSYDFWLKRLISVHAIFNVALQFFYQETLYQFRFSEESLLKWLTYIAYAGRRIKEVYGHTILTSNF